MELTLSLNGLNLLAAPGLTLSLYEVYLLAAAAMAAIWGASPAGQQASKDMAKGISNALDSSDDDTDAPTTTTTQDCSKKRECPDCPPPPPPPPPRVDRVPPRGNAEYHWPCPGDHLHTIWYETNQDPETCKCWYNKKEYVSCI